MRHLNHAARISACGAVALAVLAVSACGADDDTSGSSSEGQESEQNANGDSVEPVTEPIVTTYDGGLHVLDGETLEVAADIELDGFNRVNPAGDDGHVLVSTSTGFRILDAVNGELTDHEFEAPTPGHVVHHAGTTALFADGTGEVTLFDPDDLGDGLPETETYSSEEAHHGVAVRLDSGELLLTVGDEELVTGVRVLDADGEEIARNEDCPGTHGEATAGETVVVGCQDGLLVYADGDLTKIDSPTEYGRIGNQAGSATSPVVLGDYKQDPDAELERPEEVALVDTEANELELVDLGGASYTFRSLARGPEGEALVLGTDGVLHVIDPDSAEVVDGVSVTGEWEEPLDWQEPRPAVFVRGETAYVSEPGTSELHAVDLGSLEVTATAELPAAPNELTGVPAQ